MPTQRLLIHLSFSSNHRQQSHSIYLHSFKEFFPTGISFHLFTMYLPMYPDTCHCFAETQSFELSTRHTEKMRLYQNICLSPHQPALPFPPAPSWLAAGSAQGPPCTVRGCAAAPIPKLPGAWKTSTKAKASLHNACGNKDTFAVSSWLPSDMVWPSTGAFVCCCFPNTEWLAIPEQSLH